MASPIFSAIVVAELPAMRNVSLSSQSSSSSSSSAASANPGKASPTVGGDKTPGQPRLMLALQPPTAAGQEPRPLPDGVLTFCFPDLQQLIKKPFHYDHSAEEFQFTLTSRDEFRIHGFCRRYRVGGPSANGRLDLSPYSSANLDEASSAPAYQCICILSER